MDEGGTHPTGVRHGTGMTTSSASWAFGVDPTRQERYSLRQARYYAIAQDLAALIAQASQRGETLKLLDVGVWNGVSMRYIEEHNELGTLEFHGVDLKLRDNLYKREAWKSLAEGDLLTGLPFLPSEQFDVVICEQVLEHLPTIDVALATLSRVLKPGGTMILGVPIFTPPAQLFRKHLVPVWDRIVGTKKTRGHLQAFTRGSFLRAMAQYCDVTVQQTRGFRTISGGPLRPLENYRWWWQLNCAIGRVAPALCTEIQVVATKNATGINAASKVTRATSAALVPGNITPTNTAAMVDASQALAGA